MTMADNTIHDLLDEVNCADSCEVSIPWLQSHSIRYREPSIPNDRAT